MIAQLSEIFNNFEQLCQTDPMLALCMVVIGIVAVGAAAIGLSSFGG